MMFLFLYTKLLIVVMCSSVFRWVDDVIDREKLALCVWESVTACKYRSMSAQWLSACGMCLIIFRSFNFFVHVPAMHIFLKFKLVYTVYLS